MAKTHTKTSKRLKKNTITRLHAREEIAKLAKFPNENPNPVLRIAKDGTIIYSNESSSPILELWQYQQGRPLSGELLGFILEALTTPKSQHTEVQCAHKTYSLTFAPLEGSDFIDVYGLDITEQKKAEDALRKSTKKYKFLFDNMLDGFAYCKMVFDKNNKPVDFVYLEVNYAFEKITGLKKKDILEKKVTEVIPGIRDAHPELFDIYGKVALTGEEAKFDIEFKPLDIWLSISVYSPEKGYFVAVFENITERKQVEKTLWASEEQYRRLFESAADALLIIDSGGIIRDVNPAACSTYGYSREEFTGMPAKVIVHPGYHHIWDVAQTGSAAGDMKSLFTESIDVRKDGTSFPTEIHFSPVHYKDRKALIAAVRDITERKQAKLKLLRYHHRLRSLTAQLLLTEELERKRIAEGLHDDIIQPLIFLKIKLASLEKTVIDENITESIEEMKTMIDGLTNEARDFTFELSCPVLRQVGLEAAIEEFLSARMQAKHNIRTVFKDDQQPKPMDNNTSFLLYKAVRELLTNVVKHSKARSVVVSVAKDDDTVIISVEDDGVGFEHCDDSVDVAKPSGFGLFNIRERLDYLGGNIKIESKPGRGTKVILSAPLSRDELKQKGDSQ